MNARCLRAAARSFGDARPVVNACSATARPAGTGRLRRRAARRAKPSRPPLGHVHQPRQRARRHDCNRRAGQAARGTIERAMRGVMLSEPCVETWIRTCTSALPSGLPSPKPKHCTAAGRNCGSRPGASLRQDSLGQRRRGAGRFAVDPRPGPHGLTAIRSTPVAGGDRGGEFRLAFTRFAGAPLFRGLFGVGGLGGSGWWYRSCFRSWLQRL